MLNLKYFSKREIQTMQEIVEGKKELHREGKLYDRVYDQLVASKTMPYDVQMAKTEPPMSFCLDAIHKAMASQNKKVQ